jgi:hypothetical protein
MFISADADHAQRRLGGTEQANAVKGQKQKGFPEIFAHATAQMQHSAARCA